MCAHHVDSYGPSVAEQHRSPHPPAAPPAPNRSGAAPYEIRVKGRLEPRWAAWFDGLSVSADSDGTTVIGGSVVDQAELHSVLQKLRDLGIVLVAVTDHHIDHESPSRHDQEGN